LELESAFEAGNADDRNHVRPAADLVGRFLLASLAILNRLRERLVERRGLRPTTYFPHPAFIVALFERILQWQKYL
jgi:hypothetical protein